MKMKLLFITLLIGVCSLLSKSAYAQFFPETVHAPCVNCVPSSAYKIISGSPSVSNKSMQGGQSPWVSAQGAIIELPSSVSVQNGYQTSNPASSDYGTFLTLKSGPAGKDKVQFKVGGFIPGVTYTMEYGVASSKTQLSGFGSTATLQIASVETFPTLLATGETNFDANSYNKWLLRFIQFTPTTSEISFTLSGNTTVGTGFVNFDIWTRALHCILPPDKQVVLNTTQVSTKYPFPYKTVDLAGSAFNLVDQNAVPVSADVIWQTSPDPNKLAVIPTIQGGGVVVGPGDYYAFYYHKVNDCYALQSIASTSKIAVNYVPTQVPLNLGSTISIKCPNTSYVLTNKVLPSEVGSVVWFNNNKHLGEPIPNATVTQPGTYYAFYYSKSEGAYSVSTSTSSVTVTFETPCCQAGTAQVTVQPTAISNTCPAVTADLTTTVTNVPPNTQLVWFNNATHTGSPISNPSAVSAGTYYAFFYDPALNCYNTDNSTAQVKVTTTFCASSVQLSLKAALQGAMPSSGSKMKNELQIYGGTGLLPTMSPYSVLSSYPSINNVSGGVGEVVDWILVEIRNGSSPQTVLQSASLLLKPDGTIVDRNGLTPKFNPQAGPVRVAIKHRNHLAVMSNLIQNFSAGSTLSYDFTTALSQASNAFGDPAQMVQKNGVWCMWAGDVNTTQDLGIDATDTNGLYNSNLLAPIDTYTIYDVNMDGGVDATDSNLLYGNNLVSPYSSLINY